MIIDGVDVQATNFVPFKGELEKYAEFIDLRVDGRVDKILVTLCDDGCVDIDYVKHGQKFERIRRVTGYLVGTLDRWNDAKQAEEKDRVKHEVDVQ